MDVPLARPIPSLIPSLALAAAAPIALGGIVALRFGVISPVVMVPAITFGVVGVTSPALYIATAASGDAPTLSQMARAMTVALAAFGVALAGLILPAAFLSLSSLEGGTTIIIASVALAGAALLGLVRLAIELGAQRKTMTLMRPAVFAAWAVATLGIAARLWVGFAQGVAS